MNNNISRPKIVDTINDIEFVSLEPSDISPLISKCEIKVFYLGENRNHSYIDKDTALKMAKSLRAVPIVGAFREDKEDFGDHGHVMRIEDGEIHFSCKTVPYGFVAPDAQVWFQKFIDTDEFGNETEREYLMTTGYLWTSQYEEAMQCIAEGKGQSMELDDTTLDGHWATNNKTGIEFFIINDALFSKLCILGDDVEPCFEGAAITSPEVSANFTKDVEFQHTLFTMMNELKDALQNKGGSDMPEDKDQPMAVEETVEEVEVEEDVEESTEESAEGGADETGDFTCGDKKKRYQEKDEKDQDQNKDEDSKSGSEDSEGEKKKPAEEADEDKEKKKPVNNSLEQYEALQKELAGLREEVQQLRDFKFQVENSQKDALINKYHMLSDADKAEVIEHKNEYSLDEIESKLALIYVKRNVDFSTLTGETEEVEDSEDVSVAFSLDSEVAGYAVSGMIEALRQTKKD